ncbi:MAG: hypothetical protein IKG18_06505, partial [Atopobiaceae bacterium]|nr:hypothetical protein [Atopobiaceae bacterium]
SAAGFWPFAAGFRRSAAGFRRSAAGFRRSAAGFWRSAAPVPAHYLQTMGDVQELVRKIVEAFLHQLGFYHI